MLVFVLDEKLIRMTNYSFLSGNHIHVLQFEICNTYQLHAIFHRYIFLLITVSSLHFKS